MLKEYRCKHCRKLFFKGDIKQATIEIKCKKCKSINTINGYDCRLKLSTDQKESHKKNNQSPSLSKTNIEHAVIECQSWSED